VLGKIEAFLAAAKRGAKADWDPSIEAMITAAEAFDPAAQDTSELPRV
jgi:hypothetical protein